ncbi:Apoptosis-antagonizing transcription factor [Macleaya cordata]|uniref:Apoptosis-antagonizing transcription factor n=1 Tax=Macleaya cordata TaxID=56857 RepID=A0A200PMC7_MACCD|nr:Apoptosis-antagonizing transcription factor [Macleaya cordata]
MGLVSKRSTRVSRRGSSSEDESDPEIEMDLEEEEEEDEVEVEEEDEEEEDEEEEEEEEEDGEEEDGEKVEGQKDAEMEELEKEFLNLRQEEQDILKNLTRHKDEDLLKGQAVKNQKVLWDKTLEFRFLLQKVFSSSNKLPQEPHRSSFCGSDKAIDKAYSDLITSSEQTINCLLELQEALLEKNPSVVQITDGNTNESSKVTERSKSLDVGSDEEWLPIQRMHSRIASFRDNSIDKWQRNIQVTTGAAGFKGKLHAFNQNISEQVAAYMRDPSRMIKRMQLRRSTVGIFGGDANVDGDPELLDDSEFYQQLLKEFFESYNPASSESAFYALKRLQTKKRKIVDRRASKSRKIRYHVHEKIVNFMAPEPLNLPPMAPKLFENLFGLKNQKTTSVA